MLKVEKEGWMEIDREIESTRKRRNILQMNDVVKMARLAEKNKKMKDTTEDNNTLHPLRIEVRTLSEKRMK